MASLGLAPRSQWRDRAGLAPASLFRVRTGCLPPRTTTRSVFDWAALYAARRVWAAPKVLLDPERGEWQTRRQTHTLPPRRTVCGDDWRPRCWCAPSQGVRVLPPPKRPRRRRSSPSGPSTQPAVLHRSYKSRPEACRPSSRAAGRRPRSRRTGTPSRGSSPRRAWTSGSEGLAPCGGWKLSGSTSGNRGSPPTTTTWPRDPPSWARWPRTRIAVRRSGRSCSTGLRT